VGRGRNTAKNATAPMAIATVQGALGEALMGDLR
jgi:hypothetical protein